LPAYGDWTKPSGAGRVPSAPVPPLPAVPPAPLTSAIPDRDLAGRSAVDLDDRYEDDHLADDRYEDERYDVRYADDRHDDDRYDAEPDVDSREADLRDRGPAPSGPLTGSVVGGRAALRAEREAREASRVAAEAARRKAAGDVDEIDRPRRSRRMLKGLVAVAAVAAAVLGVYTVATPADTEETSSSSSPSTHTPAPIAPTTAAGVTESLAPLDVDPPVTETSAPPAVVRVPVTVLNSTDIDGLAADVSKKIKAKGWQTAEPNGYPKDDIAASTVFFTEGDDKQRQAALQLIEQFPQLQGPTPRFFEVPAEVDAPGLVVVLAPDWKP
jgi:hypothetical protein